MITDDTQRWRGGRDVRRPAGETIKTTECDVVYGGPRELVEDFVRAHHYAGHPSPAPHRFRLYYRGELAGAALFGPPASTNAHVKVWGDELTQKQAVTLGRLVLIDEVPGNGESHFVAQCFATLRCHGVRAVESCADPEARVDADGHATFRGHLGTVLLPDGSCLSNRAQGKLRDGERGDGHPVSQLVAWGAKPIGDDEDATAWLKTWRKRLCRTMRHRGCHRYTWRLDRQPPSYGPSRAYPKNLPRAA